MVTRRQDPSAALSKAADTFTVFYRETVAGINREKPQFVKVRTVYLTQDFIISRVVVFSISSRRPRKADLPFHP